MPYKLPRTLSFGGIRRYIVGVIGGLNAAGYQDLAQPFFSLRDQCRQLQLEQEDAREETLIQGANLRVADVAWDAAIGKLSERSFLLAGRNVNAMPYRLFFGNVTAKDARRWGVHKATVFGTRAVEKLRDRLPEANDEEQRELGPVLEQVERANVRFAAAGEDFRNAVTAERLHSPRRERFIERVEAQVAATELELYMRDPRNKALVKALLSPGELVPRKRTRRIAEVQDDADDEVEETAED